MSRVVRYLTETNIRHVLAHHITRLPVVK